MARRYDTTIRAVADMGRAPEFLEKIQVSRLSTKEGG
jgi:hypothetical protein